jgi:uncharacterized protein YyaL (SSP411 family)
MATGPIIPWREWSTEAFATAHRGSMPVLLLVTTSWSAACRVLEREVLTDAVVAGTVSDRFVAVRVDADRRPDIAERYRLDGWPTLLCLTADGEVLSGGTTVDASRLVRVLTDLAEAFTARREDIERRAREGRRARREPSGPVPRPEHGIEGEAPARVAAYLKQAFDDTWAGFGDGPKTPHSAPVAFALTHGVRTGDGELREMAVRTLDRLGWSDLSDARTGAFHRACGTRAWTEPDTARLLQVQADLAGLFLDAAVILDEDAYAERARAALTYVTDALADEAGGFFESQCTAEDAVETSGDGPARAAGRDGVDRIVVTSSNACMVRTLLRAAEVLRAPQFGEIALAAIERILPLAYSSGAGVAHYLTDGSPRVRGLLVDQVEASAALIDLAQASGNRVYLELAEELMRSCLRKLWSPEHGGFLDRLRSVSGGGDIGRMPDPLVPFATNCQAARVLARLARATGHDDLRVGASDTLAALGAISHLQGVLAADYALAVVEVTAGVEA